MTLTNTQKSNAKVNKYKTSCGKINAKYQQRIDDVIQQALKVHPRLLAIRVDFRFPNLYDPDHYARTDSSVITRLFKSIKERIKADLKRKKKAGKRVHRCHLHYLWVREFNRYGEKHYHVLLLLNKDTYFHPGDYKKADGTLASMISAAWTSALGLIYPQYQHLTHFPTNGYYRINVNGERDVIILDELYFRMKYMAKMISKSNEDGERNFGCSQK